MSDRLDIEHPGRPWSLAGIAVTGVAASALLGGATNAVNGLVSPTYFRTVLGWHHVENIWRATIAQGIFEGIAFGFFFSLIFTIATGIITGASCDYLFGAKHVVGIVVGALVLWLLGGLTAMGLATLSPDFYRRAFLGVPDDFNEMVAYAWVGGSIWGVQFGGFVCLILGIFFLRANWRRQMRIDD
jgi:hypothetical protein